MTDLILPDVKILHGNVLDRLKDLEEGSVQTVVTSPPYYGLRDYGTASWIGGDDGCEHSVGGQVSQTKDRGTSREHAIVSGVRPGVNSKSCRRCGAERIDDQIGLEESPEEYVQKLVQVFREVRRVLRDDGTVWLNLGDSFCGSGPQGSQSGVGTKVTLSTGKRRSTDPSGALKSKDLIGIPWMVAFALRDDGWYLRSDIIWSKPNPMPESVTDRPTRAHEYIFLLSKSRKYYYDAESIKESSGPTRVGGKNNGLDNPRTPDSRKKQDALGKNTYTGFNERWSNRPVEGRNKRDVWTESTKPFPEAHFATFPPALIEPCILSGAPRGGLVLDPFMGSGTTAVVALRNGRVAVGVELNEEYIAIARRRIESDGHALIERTEDWL